MQKHSGSSTPASVARIPSNPTEISVPMYADVAVPLHVSQTFTYRIPEPFRATAQLGARVLFPLGRKPTVGFIVALHERIPGETSLAESDIKELDELLDAVPLVTTELLEITRWVSEYYGAPWGEVIKAALPPGMSAGIDQVYSLTPAGRERLNALPDVGELESESDALVQIGAAGELSLAALGKNLGKARASKVVRALTSDGLIETQQRPRKSFAKAKSGRVVRLKHLDPSTPPSGKKLSEAQGRVLTLLSNRETIPLSELLAQAQVSTSAINTLRKNGYVEVTVETIRRDPLATAILPKFEEHELTEDQTASLREIEQSLHQGTYAAFLLHGVTGSGKTEVYLRAMRLCLKLDRSGMMLVPEIVLTPVFSRRLRSYFGDRIAIFHSSLSKGERFDEWMRVKRGEARIVIGTRSAVFAPTAKLGLVIVDEEHESSYRQQDSPHYHGRDTSIVRAQKENAVVILGSATPSLESFHNARTGKYRYLRLPSRIGNRPMATARIIDMREVFDRHKKPRVFSDELLEAIEETHKRNEQAIILLNRRGYSSFVLCRTCGETIQCPNCDVTLTYHRSERVIICHYCNHRQTAPTQCPSCSGKYIYYIGEGTEQIEALLRKFFPALRIARIDRDTASRRGLFEKSLLDFSERELDMLVGTQMLAKGHDFPNVTLVGVVSVDAGLALPDFRAAERTFQLITQVAGRAGRGDRDGQVLIQTYHPHHYALRHACAQDYIGFYNEEIRHRQNHSYPPFISLASLLVHGSDLSRARSNAIDLRKELDVANTNRVCRILGPAPAALARLKGEYRFQVLVKCANRRQLRGVVDNALKSIATRINLRSINLEIDPVSIM